MNVKEKLTKEWEREMDTLNKMTLGEEEHEAAAKTVIQFTDRVIKMEELEIEKEKVKNSKVDNNFKNGIAIGTAVTGATLTVLGCALSLVSEEKGIINSTQVGRKSFDRIINFFFKR